MLQKETPNADFNVRYGPFQIKSAGSSTISKHLPLVELTADMDYLPHNLDYDTYKNPHQPQSMGKRYEIL
jgi:hypothetical protein